jgi:hypothetical protein
MNLKMLTNKTTKILFSYPLRVLSSFFDSPAALLDAEEREHLKWSLQRDRLNPTGEVEHMDLQADGTKLDLNLIRKQQQ